MPAWPFAVTPQAVPADAAFCAFHSCPVLARMLGLCMAQLGMVAAAVVLPRMLCCR